MSVQSVQDHYQNHLSGFYSWMLGDFNIRQKKEQEFFEVNQIIPQSDKIAFDLGAGSGLQSISLANLGFEVKAIDTDEYLLRELEERKAGLKIEIIHSDIQQVENINFTPELIICMGDTLPHLPSKTSVETFLKNCYKKLQTDGKLILSFRDYSTSLEDTNRFIPVRSDDNRIFTCILEYFPERVKVTDQLYEKTSNGWVQKVSSYYKIRLTLEEVRASIEQAGFKISKCQELNRMFYLIASK